MRSPFAPDFDSLPSTLPLFPLPNAIAMPGAQLPLNIFEPRYLSMIFDALAGPRLIGMVQPEAEQESQESDVATKLFGTGTAGLITSFTETSDGRLLIVLTGICRFDIKEELSTTRSYRRALVDWTRFEIDFADVNAPEDEQPHLLALLRAVLEKKGAEADWKAIEGLPLWQLVNMLVGQLPLEVAERQVLVEAVTPEERVRLLTSLLDVAVLEDRATAGTRH